jgi:hypothetical protein
VKAAADASASPPPHSLIRLIILLTPLLVSLSLFSLIDFLLLLMLSIVK